MTDSVPDNVVLEKLVKDILTVIKPVEDDRNKRLSTILELENCMHSIGALKSAAVKPFGSFVSDLYSKSGDLDLSVHLGNGSNLPVNKKKKQSVLREVRKALLTRGVAGYMQFIPHARVPVLQYVSNRFGISCDISIDNYAGRIKSKIFYWVNTLDERFGDMVLLIKEWAKAQNINDPKTGSLNSYSLCLLVLFHFQTSQPPILPPLKEIYEGNITEDITEGVSYNEEQINEALQPLFIVCNPRETSSDGYYILTAAHCPQFIHIDAHPDEVISTFTGQYERTQDNPARMKKSYHLFVEDPVERPDNAARAVSMKGLHHIASAFNDAYRKFDSLEHIDRNELLALLCTPGVGLKLGGRVMANSYTNTPQRSHQHIRPLGHVGRDNRFRGARGLTGSRQRNQPPTTAVQQTAHQTNRAHETAGRYQNRNHPQAYIAGHQAVPYQNHYHPQAYVTGNQALPYQNHYHPQMHPAEPYQNYNQLVHTGPRPRQSPNQFHTQVLPTAGTYQTHNQQVYYPELHTSGLYQNQPRGNGNMSNNQTHRTARTVKYQPVRGQFDNGSTRESRSQASNSVPSQR
ncbi:hypothetical protein EJB05_52644 [Eragrostis curvula]|uniref:Poly(A) RNA polymerase mitochondrial-like central palm domain-containing protein n=1 Tax=Eragrostis curvula TaxID=38414 RepID=A0A5J9SSE9_9POAL|nr:hypothetical protein EJB05_52644 [Eragrostis curvula]